MARRGGRRRARRVAGGPQPELFFASSGVERRTGLDASADAWRQVHAGAVPPSVGVIASMT